MLLFCFLTRSEESEKVLLLKHIVPWHERSYSIMNMHFNKTRESSRGVRRKGSAED
jgi:hypothetical protein